ESIRAYQFSPNGSSLAVPFPLGRRWFGSIRACHSASHTLLFPCLQRRIPISMQPFAENSIVLVTLNSPREKYWGSVIAVNPAGISLRGMDLNSFDDFARQVK